jgi:hypothetical protein
MNIPVIRNFGVLGGRDERRRAPDRGEIGRFCGLRSRIGHGSGHGRDLLGLVPIRPPGVGVEGGERLAPVGHQPMRISHIDTIPDHLGHGAIPLTPDTDLSGLSQRQLELLRWQQQQRWRRHRPPILASHRLGQHNPSRICAELSVGRRGIDGAPASELDPEPGTVP